VIAAGARFWKPWKYLEDTGPGKADDEHAVAANDSEPPANAKGTHATA
jgi:hypothetical protein